MSNINIEIDNFLNYLKFERGLSDNTCQSYSVDLTEFASFLSEKEIEGIVDIQLNNYLKELLSSRDLQIKISNEAKKFLASKGWNPQF